MPGSPRALGPHTMCVRGSPALRIPAVEAGLAVVHKHQRLGIALVAHHRAGRKGQGFGAGRAGAHAGISVFF